MNTTMAALPDDDPKMAAWNAYKQTEAFANSRHWALRVAPMFQAGEGRDATHDLMPLEQRARHVEGSLWASFVAGYNAARGITEHRGSAAMGDLRPYINSICEPGNSRAHGAWVDGHQDVTAFMFAVRDEFQRLIPATDVRHGYYRVLRGVMHFTSAPGNGASPVTWAEW